MSAQLPTDMPESRSGLLVQGVIREAGSGALVRSARLRLVPVPEGSADTLSVRGSEQPPEPLETLSDTTGTFRWAQVPPGSYQLEVSALGYRELQKEVQIEGAPPVEIRVDLVPEALSLEPVVVVVLRSARLDANGFYQRQQQGAGRFMERDDIQRRGGSRVSDLLRGMAGIQIQPTRAGQVSRVILRGGCRPDVVVDGINLGPNLSPDDVLSPGDLEGIEVHSGASAPSGLTRGGCGMLVFWTVDPAARGGTAPLSWWRLTAGVVFALLALLATR